MEKPRYRCELITLGETGGVWYALIRRQQTHFKLGEPNGRVTRTSPILRIDMQFGVIETMNSYYIYKDR